MPLPSFRRLLGGPDDDPQPPSAITVVLSPHGGGRPALPWTAAVMVCAKHRASREGSSGACSTLRIRCDWRLLQLRAD